MKASEIIANNQAKIADLVNQGAGYLDIKKVIGFEQKDAMVKMQLNKAGINCDCDYAREMVEVTDLLEDGQSVEESLAPHFDSEKCGDVWYKEEECDTARSGFIDRAFIYVYKF